jgi:ABC-2 type transport system ATP-binding protein
VVDEPFAGLDPVNTRLVKEIFEEQRQAGKSILMSTHQMYQVEALCNRIVLIDDGRAVLYGAVDEIKRSFAGNAVVIQGQGDFTHIPGVLEARQHNGAWQMALEIGADPQAVFRTLAAREDVRIERFELAQPSLDDIFINVVQNGMAKLEASHA